MANRRKLLKGLGALGAAGFAQPIKALEGSETIQYKGVTYDSTTLQLQGECSATVDGSESKEMNLSIPGHEIVLNSELSAQDGGIARLSGLTDNHDLGDDQVLIRSTFQGPFITGYITKKSREYSNLGFTMASKGAGLSPSSIGGALPDKAQSPVSEKLSRIPDVPSTGIPENTTIQNLKAMMEGQTDV